MRSHNILTYFVNHLNVINNIRKKTNEKICDTRSPCDKIKYKINDSR